jgi:hypothetical protein
MRRRSSCAATRANASLDTVMPQTRQQQAEIAFDAQIADPPAADGHEGPMGGSETGQRQAVALGNVHDEPTRAGHPPDPVRDLLDLGLAAAEHDDLGLQAGGHLDDPSQGRRRPGGRHDDGVGLTPS